MDSHRNRIITEIEMKVMLSLSMMLVRQQAPFKEAKVAVTCTQITIICKLVMVEITKRPLFHSKKGLQSISAP